VAPRIVFEEPSRDEYFDPDGLALASPIPGAPPRPPPATRRLIGQRTAAYGRRPFPRGLWFSLHIDWDDDILNRLAYFNQLRCAGLGVRFQLAAVRPLVNFIVMCHPRFYQLFIGASGSSDWDAMQCVTSGRLLDLTRL
jgi:hypothetical protein